MINIYQSANICYQYVGLIEGTLVGLELGRIVGELVGQRLVVGLADGLYMTCM